MSPNKKLCRSVRIDTEQSCAKVYARLQEVRLALPKSGLVSVNLDIPLAVATALAASTKVKGLRDKFLCLEPTYLENLDQLEDYALALEYAHLRCLVLGQPQDGLIELNNEGNETRKKLYSVLAALAQYKVIHPESLRKYTGRTGYQKVVNDLLLTVEVFRGNWAALEGKSPVTKEQIDRAEQVALRMQHLVGARRVKSPTKATEAADQRTRAFNLLLRCYELVRRAVRFLFATDAEADSWIPNLYAQSGSKASRSKAAKAKAQEEQSSATASAAQSLEHEEQKERSAPAQLLSAVANDSDLVADVGVEGSALGQGETLILPPRSGCSWRAN